MKMIKNANVEYSVLNNTERRHIKEYFCHLFKGAVEIYINKNSNIEHITLKSDEFDKIKADI